MAGRGEPQNSARRVAAVEKQVQALQLRRAGASYRTIAGQLGYKTEQGAWKAVAAGLKKTIVEPAAEVRTLELDRLDRLLLSLWPQATAIPPDLACVDRVLRIMERRAELQGLDAPTKIAPTAPG